jgi:hypothetical protein
MEKSKKVPFKIHRISSDIKSVEKVSNDATR